MKNIVKLGLTCGFLFGLVGCSFTIDNPNDISTYQKMKDIDLNKFVETCEESSINRLGNEKACELAKQAKEERKQEKGDK